jgi:serine phosphatase RsbU (regulator of sigma subunit)
VIEGRFIVPADEAGQRVRAWLEGHLPEVLEGGGARAAEERELILGRTVAREGKSRAHVNHRPVTQRVLRELAIRLVEIHGQTEHQRLLDAGEQLRLLDTFGALDDELRVYREARASWLELVEPALRLESERKDTYTEPHLKVLHAFASQAAAAIERARLLEQVEHRRQLERELAIARQIQISFLPKADPVVPGFEIHGLNLPYSEVGGDYFDFIPIVDNQLGVAISDVSGKGIPAALLMAAYRAMLLAEIRNQFALRIILAKVNRLLHESTDRGKFVTAFYGDETQPRNAGPTA